MEYNKAEKLVVNLHSPPGMKVMTHHQMFNMVAWWKTCRNEIWLDFLRSTINTVSISSMALEKKYHHSTFATWQTTRSVNAAPAVSCQTFQLLHIKTACN